MIKLIYKTLITLVLLLIVLLVYLSTVGIKTDKLNPKIISQIKKIEPNIEVNLNEVVATLDPFNFGVNVKTIGTDIVYRDKVIKFESIKSNISLKSFINQKFAVKGISISTKSLPIKDLITFIRLLNNDPKLFIAEQFIKNGYLVADIILEFDELGNIKENYKIKGLVRNGYVSLLKKYNFNKIDFIFSYEDKNLKFKNINLFLNNKNISIPELTSTRKNNRYSVSGKINNNNIELDQSEIKNFTESDLLGLKIKKITFSSQSDFKFELARGYKIEKFDIRSDINLSNLKLTNSYELKKFFPNIKKEIVLKNQKVKVKYKIDDLSVVGNGDVILQDKVDKIKYDFVKKKNLFQLNSTLNILDNPFEINLINFKKKDDLEIILKIVKEKNKKIIFNEISLKEKNNIISFEDLVFSNNYKVYDIKKVNIDYLDKDNLKNKLKFIKNNKDYFLIGSSFNANNTIDKLLNSNNDGKYEFFNNNLKLNIDIQKVYLDKNNIINNLKGYLLFHDNEISELNLQSNFSKNKQIKFTLQKKDSEIITTLFSDNAKPLVDRYKFIKGFNEGSLDFYSVKKNDESKSTLKIYDFKLKELPVLTKVLTLASLQGIADLLSGEGIRFNEFEMNFTNNKSLMTIDEIYAIGPAISILMDGYIEKDKLISLRGSLVPATTINKTIGSLPLIGNILVGKKIGEGVFGVSFKVKGPANDLETTVNPIKTLTPRFITRTLEKIKKN